MALFPYHGLKPNTLEILHGLVLDNFSSFSFNTYLSELATPATAVLFPKFHVFLP